MKKIGILTTSGTDTIYLDKHYFNYFSHFGQVVLLMFNEEVRQDLDLLVLPGGADVDPNRYTTDTEMLCGRIDAQKEWFDKYRLPKYIKQDTPIFGICRGEQSLYVHLGGTLIQHVTHKKSYDLCEDVIVYNKNGLEARTIKTNSVHHQVCDLSTKPDSVQILATSKPYEEIEAWACTDKPIAAVQWHPERINCEYSKILIESLLDI